MPRLRFILRIEPDDDDSRVMYAKYLDTFGFTVLTADTMDDASTRATDADVIALLTESEISRPRAAKADRGLEEESLRRSTSNDVASRASGSVARWILGQRRRLPLRAPVSMSEDTSHDRHTTLS